MYAAPTGTDLIVKAIPIALFPDVEACLWMYPACGPA